MNDRESFEKWYMSLPGSDHEELEVRERDSAFGLKGDYYSPTREIFQGWQAAKADSKAEIERLKAENEKLRTRVSLVKPERIKEIPQKTSSTDTITILGN